MIGSIKANNLCFDDYCELIRNPDMEVRKLVISLVLATDMATHFGHLATLKNYGSVRIVDAAPPRHRQRAVLRRRRDRVSAMPAGAPR